MERERGVKEADVERKKAAAWKGRREKTTETARETPVFCPYPYNPHWLFKDVTDQGAHELKVTIFAFCTAVLDLSPRRISSSV